MAFLSQAPPLEGLLPPHGAFQEHAAHPPRWPGELRSKGSSDTCISDGVSTFLYRAFTAHGAHLVLIHADFALASFETRFNTGARFDHPRQLVQRWLLKLRRRHARRREVVMVAVVFVLIGRIARGTGLQHPIVRQGTAGDSG